MANFAKHRSYLLIRMYLYRHWFYIGCYTFLRFILQLELYGISNVYVTLFSMSVFSSFHYAFEWKCVKFNVMRIIMWDRSVTLVCVCVYVYTLAKSIWFVSFFFQTNIISSVLPLFIKHISVFVGSHTFFCKWYHTDHIYEIKPGELGEWQSFRHD